MRRLLFMALTAAASSWAGIGQWTSLGGPEGGNIAILAIDPNTADTIYAARNGGSTFTSIDGGARWTVTDFPIGRVIIDPKDSQTLYVVTPKRVSACCAPCTVPEFQSSPTTRCRTQFQGLNAS